MKAVLVNTGSNLTVVVVKLLITFIMTPVFIHNLGNYDYGIWEVLTAVVGYMGLLDMGLKPAISRYAAGYKASNQSEKLKALYSTSFVFLVIVGIALCIFLILWGLFYPELLSKAGANSLKYSLLLFIVGAQLLIEFPGYVAESFLEGFQKYYLKNNITIFNSILGSSILYFTIKPENALVLLAGVNAIGVSIKYLIYMFMLSRSNFGGFKPSLSAATLQSFRETVGFGLKSLIQGVASRVAIGTDTIVISFFLGPAMVPFYAIPSNLISYIRNIGWTLTHAFMPLFSEMHAKDLQTEMQVLYLNASRWVVALLLPTCVGITLVGGDFIGIWVGQQYKKDADVIILLLVIYTALPFLNPFSTRYLTAINKHELLAKLYTYSSVINLISSIILVRYWGITGVAFGSVVSIIIVVPIILNRCCRYLKISITQYVLHSIVPAILPTGIMWCVVYGFTYIRPVNSYLSIIEAVIIGCIVYSSVFYIFSMQQNERIWIKLKCSNLINGRRK